MRSQSTRVPPGPEEEFRPGGDLLAWMARQFDRYGDIFKARAYGTDVYAIRDPGLAHHVLVTNWTNYVKGQFIHRVAMLLGDGIMVSEGELWKRQRRMIHPAFHDRSIARLTGMMAAVNDALLGRWEQCAASGREINVTRDTSAMALEVILRALFGGDYEEMSARFALLSGEPGRNLEFAGAFRALRAGVMGLVARRRLDDARAGDFLDALMRARDPVNGESMPDGRLVNEALTAVVAGHETTASTLNWTWYLVSRHPDVEARLQREADRFAAPAALADLPGFPYSRQVLDESMRLYPAGWLLTRRALQDDRLGEYAVPAGSEVYVPPYFIQRNPRVWPDAERFDPERFAPGAVRQRHRLAAIPFSAGPRNCIGEQFARVEMQIHLLTVAARLRLRYIGSGAPQLDAGVNLRSKGDLMMRAEIRCAAA